MTAIVKADAVDIAGELPQIFKLASALKQAGGFLPAHIRNEGELVAIILAGRELGISPMASLRSINLIKGRVTLAADMQLALMMRAGASVKWLSDGSNGIAQLQLKRPNQDTHTQTFTMEDAKTAQLTGGENWRKYPAAMLRARCVSAASKAYFPDVLSGVYTPEEMESAMTSGEVVEDARRSPDQAQQATTVEPAPAKPRTDEYGLTVPSSPCPKVSRSAKEHGGKLWTNVPEWMVCKWLDEQADKMDPVRLEWAQYIATRRQARKAKEERDAVQAEMLDANSEGGGWVAGEVEEPEASEETEAAQ